MVDFWVKVFRYYFSVDSYLLDLIVILIFTSVKTVATVNIAQLGCQYITELDIQTNRMPVTRGPCFIEYFKGIVGIAPPLSRRIKLLIVLVNEL